MAYREAFLVGTPSALQAWSAVNGAKISVVNSTSPVSSALPNSLEVTIPSTASGSVGVANSGYFGEERLLECKQRDRAE